MENVLVAMEIWLVLHATNSLQMRKEDARVKLP